MSGKITAANRPVFKSPPAASEILPTIAGLAIAPVSPAKAKNANMAVPPLGHLWEDILMEPGHIIPTARPQRAQPARPRTGTGDRDASR